MNQVSYQSSKFVLLYIFRDLVTDPVTVSKLLIFENDLILRF